MRYFTFVFSKIVISTFVQISARQLFADDKQFYVSEPSVEFDHVTSREQCTARAGKLLYANATVNEAPPVVKDLNLTANTSYWLDGNAPTYIGTNSCLLLSEAMIIMAVGCQQHHGYICEIDELFSQTFSAAISTDEIIDHSSSIASSYLENASELVGSELHTSYLSQHIPDITVTDWHAVNSQYYFTTSSANLFSISTHHQLLPTPTPTQGSASFTVSPTPVVADLHVHSSSQYTPPGVEAQTSAAGNQNSTDLICSSCCSSLSLHELLLLVRNRSLSENFNSDILNETLVVNARETGKAKRKLTSARDSRTSSKAMGGVAVVIIALVPVCLILMDLPLLIKHWTCFKTRLRRSC